MGRIHSWKRPWCWERLTVGGEGDDRGWDSWMASPTWWTWVRVGSRSWWWTGKPGVLKFMGSQRVGHDWATGLNWVIILKWYRKKNHSFVYQKLTWFCMSVICQKQAYELIEKETKFVVIRSMGGWAVDEDGQYVQISKISTRDVIYNMINIINTLYMKVRVNWKSCHHTQIFCVWFIFVSVWDNGCLLNLLWKVKSLFCTP